MHRITHEPEKFQLTIASFSKANDKVEVVVDPDEALAMREGKAFDADDVLKSQDIFIDAQKGMLASEDVLNRLFEGLNHEQMLEKIVLDGQVHFTAAFLKQKREAKRKQIVSYLHKNAMDPQTKLPHPVTRIENALEQVSLHVDPFAPVQKQSDEVLKKLKPILPISIATVHAQIHVTATDAAKIHGKLLSFGTKISESWLNDGSLLFVTKVSPGDFVALSEYVNKATHGSAEIEEIVQK